jgi:hypothetical protein
MPKEKTVRMEYTTYAFLQDLIDLQVQKNSNEFAIACGFVSKDVPRRGQKSGIEKAHEVFCERIAKLEGMKRELKAVAASTYKDHPNPKMREFWGLTVDGDHVPLPEGSIST